MESERWKRQVNHFCPFLISLTIHIGSLVFMSVLLLSDQQVVKSPVVEISFDTTENIEPVELAPVVIEEIASDSISTQESDSSSLVVTEEILDVSYVELDTPTIDALTPSAADLLTSISPVPTPIRSTGRSVSNLNKQGSNGIGEGIKGGIKARLEQHGAGTGDVQVSIAWDNYNDIDVWVVLRDGRGNSGSICWINRSLAGGFLDIDKNVRPETNKAIENIFWPLNSAPYCQYTVYVQHYHKWDSVVSTKVLIRILVDGTETFKQVTVGPMDGLKKIHTFTRRPTKNKVSQKPLYVEQASPVLESEPEIDPYADLIQQAPTFR